MFALGNDGREHWVARKTCNYLTEAIDVSAVLGSAELGSVVVCCGVLGSGVVCMLPQVCGDGLLKDGCMTEDTLAKQKDKQVSSRNKCSRAQEVE